VAELVADEGDEIAGVRDVARVDELADRADVHDRAEDGFPVHVHPR
jgi:hypothetical protein